MTGNQTTTIVTDLPQGFPAENVLAAFHDHALIISVNEDLIEYNQASGDPTGKAEYNVTEKRPLGKSTHELTMVNKPDGLDTFITAHPPFGLMKINSQYRVVNGQIKEDVSIEANRAMIGTVKGNVEKSHKEWHQKIIELAKTKSA